MSEYHGFKPEWEHEPPHRSFRSIFKWGNPNEHKEPNERLSRLMKETFGLEDADFTAKRDEGLDAVPGTWPSGSEPHHVAGAR
jgi:alkyldihydroxyacetonephosphate synthase